jgi:hypothetical protein
MLILLRAATDYAMPLMLHLLARSLSSCLPTVVTVHICVWPPQRQLVPYAPLVNVLQGLSGLLYLCRRQILSRSVLDVQERSARHHR